MRVEEFRYRYPFLTPLEAIEYFSVFEGYPLDRLDLDIDLQKSIKINVIDKCDLLRGHFIYTGNLSMQKSIEKILYKLSINDRKILRSFRKSNLDFSKETIYKKIFEQNLLSIEKSREEKKELPKGYKLKKELRKYKIENKVEFNRNFDRFWFRFIAKNMHKILANDCAPVLEDIYDELDHFISRSFERICSSWIEQMFDDAPNAYSYWDKNVELDIFASTEKGKNIVGECKWTNHKVNKGIINVIHKKCDMCGIKADIIVLFSKSGFSKELIKNCPKNVHLYDIEKISKEFFDR